MKCSDRDFVMRLDEHITAIPINLPTEMELNSCECDKNCPESVPDEELVRCGFCEKYISFRCIETHINKTHLGE